MFSTLLRIVKYGLVNFRRNAWLSTATVAILTMTLIVFAGLYLFNVLTNVIVASVQDKIDISVYFNTDAPEDEILRIRATLKDLPEVKEISYVSKDEALEIFKQKHADDDTISSALDQLEDNPLLASLNIKAHDTEEYSVIAAYLNNESIAPFVENVTYSQNAAVIERLGDILRTAQRGGIALTIVLSLIAILITFNTIRLAIHSSRESITIMRLVGGSNLFIRGPFLVEAVVYGLISAVVSVLIIAPMIYLISPYSSVLVPELDLWTFFVEKAPMLIVYQLCFGVFLGLISSSFAMRRHLK